MKALVINLAGAADRMAFQTAQLDRLGIPFERVEAITPATLEPPADDPVWHRWQRPLRVTEMALLASHRVCWRRILDSGAPALILEDDALLSPSTPDILRRLAPLVDVDHVTLETRGRRKLLGRDRHPALPIRRLWQDRTGSAAYVLFPAGADILMRCTDRVGAPSDAAISSAYEMRSWQADPALAVQLDKCPDYGLTQPIPTASSIDAVRKPLLRDGYSPLQRIGFRARRIAAQLHMFGRSLLRIGRTERRHVMPAADFTSSRD